MSATAGRSFEQSVIMAVTSILIVGVGGQGTLLTSRILGRLFVSLGHDVKISEIHGMAQRGGSVVTHVRYGDKVYSPIVEPGGADHLLAFESMEALRWIHYLKPGGGVVMNIQQIAPMPVITGQARYPSDIPDQLRGRCGHLSMVDAVAVAKRLGTVKVFNVVLLGVLSRLMPIDRDAWRDAIDATVPARFRELNLRAFDIGSIVVCEK